MRLVFLVTFLGFSITAQAVPSGFEEAYEEHNRESEINNSISFNRYYRHNEINSYLKELASNYPDLVTLQSIGKSYEGRDLTTIKISSGGTSTKPAILIDAGIHAREWIAPAMALYIISQLVENNAANSGMTDAVDWYILPVLNPDGYEFSHAYNRTWRKTRSRSNASTCIGVDGNRNFNFHWMEAGASNNPCNDDYAGPYAFSEPETRALRDFALANSQQIKLYLSLHTHGGYILYPWGYEDALPSDWKTLHSLAEMANAAYVEAGGESYIIGGSTNALYAAAGGAHDYMKGVAGVALSYTIELTNTEHKHEIPAELIEPTVTRLFAIIRVYGTYVKENF
ncbi:carboxypeptidase B-like [Periplaneta americana]|uniref:carboxypeptidase B-like n=1 Tax=Periplaneta americana TaxID=6978 RepID=UPI0037E72AE3